MMNATFAAWLPDVIRDPVTVSPHDLDEEVRGNTWSFSLGADEAAKLTTSDVEEFVLSVLRARSASLAQAGVTPGAMTFYCWFDEQACHLRFNLASVRRDKLPFGCQIIDSPLSEILGAFLNSPYHDGIPWSALTDVPASSSVEAEPFRLAVWSTAIP